MFFDATAKHDGSVVEAVDKLFSCCAPTDKTHANNKPMPPLVVFQWGAITSFPAYVTQVSAKYTLFTPEGTPIRALCTVTLQEMPQEKGKQNPTSGSIAARSIHRVVTGDTLASIAYREYGDPTMWRPLANFNRIDDPVRLPLGSMLMLPSAAELAGAGDLMAPTSSSFLVDIDGSPLAADAKALLVSAVVDDSLRLPDFFLLRFRDPDRLVITKSGAKIGSKVKVSVASDASDQPAAADRG